MGLKSSDVLHGLVGVCAIAEAKLGLQPKTFDAACYAYWQDDLVPDLCLRRQRLRSHPRGQVQGAPWACCRSSASVLEMLYKNYLPCHA